MYDTDLKSSGLSLVSSPPSQLLSLEVRTTQRRPGENHHVMYATVNNSYGGGLAARQLFDHVESY